MNWKTALMMLAGVLALSALEWFDVPATLANLSDSWMWTAAPWVLLVVFWVVIARQLRGRGMFGPRPTDG